jgi:hypothetical protein
MGEERMKYLPQIIWFALMLFDLLYSAYNHGKPRGVYNIWVTLIATSIFIPLLYWGGFFDVFFK